ncbi:6719_t:CDS:2, partial [Acaulospora colombiana]
RALQRHMRLMGIERWKMSELIASLPLLIFVALFLFFIGIAHWLWHMNRTTSGIVIGGIGIGCLLYTITKLISIITVDAPFRTPVSKELIGIVRQALRLTFTKREEEKFEGKGEIALDGLFWIVSYIEVSPASRNMFITLIKQLTEKIIQRGRLGDGEVDSQRNGHDRTV